MHIHHRDKRTNILARMQRASRQLFAVVAMFQISAVYLKRPIALLSTVAGFHQPISLPRARPSKRRVFSLAPRKPFSKAAFPPTFSTSAIATSSAQRGSLSGDDGEQFIRELQSKFQKAVALYESNLQATPIASELSERIQALQEESASATFWEQANRERNTEVTSRLSEYTRLQQRIKTWEAYKEDAEVALDMLKQKVDIEDADADACLDNSSEGSTGNYLFIGEERQSLVNDLQKSVQNLLHDTELYELELILSGPYDNQPCRLILTAGAGGTEANDWVADLKRMYERHAEQMGFKVQEEDSLAGEMVGFKSVELIINKAPAGSSTHGPGNYPFGWFKGEKGAHRLVRLSPFNANNKRQTTFAGVDVAPILEDDLSLNTIDIPDKDLEITTMRSGGAGGQNVNKVSSAVRIKHLPSGLTVKCTQERSQAQNKDIAMKRLKAQLLAIAREQRVTEIQQIRGDQVEATWGAQIRNYVLHPYKLVKDQRTGWETSDTQSVLDGDLEACIAANLRFQATR